MKKKYDLTEGGILSKLLLVAIPIMGTQLMQMLYNLTDMYWLGHMSSDAVSASGTAGMFMWLSMAFMLMGRMGSEIGVSQNLGKNDENAARRFSQNALFIAISLGIIYGLTAVFFSKQLVSVFNIQESHVAADAAMYLSIVGIGCPMTFVSGVMVGTFNGAGNSRMSFIANSAGLAINIILDPILIFTFDMGVMGAAVATVAAQAVVMTIFLVAIKRHKNRPFHQYRIFIKPELKIIKEIIKWCLPISLESLLFTALAMVTTRFVAAFGSDAIAAQRVGSQVESLSWLIGGGFGSAITTFIGQNYGAGKWSRIRSGFKVSVLVMTSWGIIVTLLLFFFGRFMFSLFLSEPEILDMGTSFLKILALCQVLQCLESVCSGVFRGRGRTVPPSVSSITGNLIRVPLAYLLSKTSLGLDGIWLGVTIGATIRGLMVLTWHLIESRKFPREDTVTT